MNKTYKNEQGRSMVEMLGVLAVIGVLSVAGIAGYSMAMRNYRTNEVLNAASMLYVMAMAKNQGTGADTNYTELGTPPSGTTLAYTASTKSIAITFSNEDDCKQAKTKLGDKAPNECSAVNEKYNLTLMFGDVSATNSQPLENTYTAIKDRECSFEDNCYVSDGENTWRLMYCSNTPGIMDTCSGTTTDCSWIFEYPPCNTLL